MYYNNTFVYGSLTGVGGVAVWPLGPEPPVVRVGEDQALVFTMRDLNQQTARILKEIEQAGKPAIITRRGRFIATITPIAPGQVESRVMPEMARQFAKRDPSHPVAAIAARPRWSRALLARL